MALLASGLLPASFRGAPFAVNSNSTAGGRRLVVHQYPGKELPWTEDMGREARRFRFRGFIVDGDVLFAGGPIQLQRALLIAALEKSGPGTLTHPTLGILNVSCARFDISEDLGAGRMSSVEVEFVESGKRTFPASLLSSSGLLSAATLTTAALVVDGLRLVALGAAMGGRRQDLTTTSAVWNDRIVMLASDATALHRLTAQLPGNFGRFAGGGNSGINGARDSIYGVATTTADLTVIASQRRAAVAAAAQVAATAAGTADMGYATAFAAAIVAAVKALADACADPADAIRLLEQLLSYVPDRPETGSAIGTATGSMVRRAAAAGLTIAAGDYQPTSSDDAAAMINRLAPLLDTEATRAADNGDDASFKALRAARGAIVADLRARGSTLARVTTVTVARALPAAVLAQRLYRDIDRAAQLISQAAPVHPLFMPTSFTALAA
jgi:prophage DNA circulation protein